MTWTIFKRSLIIFVLSFFAKTFAVNAQTFTVDTILYNGDPNKLINLVFMSDGFQQSELSTFITKTRELTNYFFSISPFTEYKNYFNVFAIRVPSAQSGASHPGNASDENTSGGQPVLSVNTYFNSTFDYFSIHRLLVPQNDTALNSVLASNFPLFDKGLILINSPYYGGSGGTYSASSLNTSSYEVLAHEFGHSFAGLADEYYAGDFYAREYPNMTKETNPVLVTWKNWLNTGGVGIYQHCCGESSALWYKPSNNCKMQTLGAPFCPVCKETIVETIHRSISPINKFEPANPNVVGFCNPPVKFKLSLIKPIPNTLLVEWRLNGNLIGRNIDSISINPGQLAAGNNTLYALVIDTTALTRSNTHPSEHSYVTTWTLNGTSIAAPIVSASGATSFCGQGNITLTSSATAGNQWYKDGVIMSGSTGNTISVNETGNYTAKIITGPCESVPSNSIAVTINIIPPTPVITASSSTTICEGASVVLTSNAAIGNQWYKDGALINGGNGSTISVTSNGSYTVKTIVGGCESVISNAIVVALNPPLITPAITAGSSTTFCTEGSVILTSSASSGNQWYNNGVAIMGSTSTTLNVTSGGSYTVKSILNGCESAVSNIVPVTENPIPPTPSITQTGDQLSSSAVAGNQWYLNGNMITGATGQTFKPALSGNYTVVVTQNNCSSKASARYNFLITGIPNIDVFDKQVKVLPNPVKDKLVITSTNRSMILTVRICDVNGKQLKTITSSSPRFEIDMSKYAEGLYVIWIEDKLTKTKAKKMIVKL